jgi:nicotinamidase-related amidase
MARHTVTSPGPAGRASGPQAAGPAPALLLIDVINAFDFEGADALLRHALPAARRIAALKRRARRAGVPVIYVNDNFGEWGEGWDALVRRCMQRAATGREFVASLLPSPGDYHVLKPLHSGFLSTSLSPLLDQLGVRTLVLTGVAAHICVLFTAVDAYMRGLEVIVASDCVASERPRDRACALELMKGALKARIAPARLIRLEERPARRAPARRSPRRSSRASTNY